MGRCVEVSLYTLPLELEAPGLWQDEQTSEVTKVRITRTMRKPERL